MKIIRTVFIIMFVLWACNGFAQTDTVYIHDTVRIETVTPQALNQEDSLQWGMCINVYMPSFYGGYVKLDTGKTLYQMMFGVLPPLPTNYELVPRKYRFMTYSGIRITCFKTGAWVAEKLINGTWTPVEQPPQ